MRQVQLPPQETFTVAELAALLRCHAETIRREIKRGRLRAFRPVGNRRSYLIARADVLAALESVQPEAQSGSSR